MNEHNTQTGHSELITKIARLVEEKGWNQEDFANIAGLNRQTVRQILQPTGDRRLRNATIASCAKALNLSVHELRTVPIERLLQRVRQSPALINGDDRVRRLYEQSTQEELRSWLERNPERAQQLTNEEIDELLAMQSAGTSLATFGIEGLISQLERKRNLLIQIHAIANTEYLDLLEQFVGLIYDKVQSHRR
jgi:transcriptional regulator with XRE-family HTH domain